MPARAYVSSPETAWIRGEDHQTQQRRARGPRTVSSSPRALACRTGYTRSSAGYGYIWTVACSNYYTCVRALLPALSSSSALGVCSRAKAMRDLAECCVRLFVFRCIRLYTLTCIGDVRSGVFVGYNEVWWLSRESSTMSSVVYVWLSVIIILLAVVLS